MIKTQKPFLSQPILICSVYLTSHIQQREKSSQNYLLPKYFFPTLGYTCVLLPQSGFEVFNLFTQTGLSVTAYERSPTQHIFFKSICLTVPFLR